MTEKTDKVYATEIENIGDFRFDDSVADVFEDMIQRSVPGYRMTLNMLSIIAHHFATPGTNCYDLGCSLGAGMIAMDSKLSDKNCNLVGVDTSAAMLERCSQHLTQAKPNSTYQLREEDVCDTPMENASMVVLNFTLQFIDPTKRLALLQKTYQSLQKGGALVLSEKIRFDDTHIQNSLSELYHDFKRTQGYSDLEISQKRSALEKVLIPETLSAHHTRLREAGFTLTETWFQCFNFVSILAIKE